MPLELTARQLTGVTLESHLLRDKAKSRDLVGVVGRICGLNAQTARGPHISLWNRIENYKWEDLAKSLYKEKRLVKAWLMRGTVHIIPVSDFAVYQKAVGRNLSEDWESQLAKRDPKLSIKRMKNLYEAVLDVLGLATLTRRELVAQVSHLLKGNTEKERKILVGRVLRGLTYRGLVCHADPTGTWYYFKENRFTTIARWAPGIDLSRLDEAEARRLLLLDYLHGYGPASIQDFAYWAGFKVTTARLIFEGARSELAEIRIKGAENRHWMRKEDVAHLESSIRSRRLPVRFLPEFDPLIMGHKNKIRIMDEEDRKRVFLRLADVAPTILINGRIGGTWSHKIADGTLEISLFRSQPIQRRSGVRPESKRLSKFLTPEHHNIT